MPNHNAPRPAILLLGTGHWSNPGLDYRQTEFDDMLAPRRQREIEEVADSLAVFGATKVALEVERQHEPALIADYEAYLHGKFELTANERHQIGFRLASMHDHPQVYGVDWHHPTQPIGWDDAISFARRHAQERLISFFTDTDRCPDEDQTRVQRTHVRDLLIEASDMLSLAENHRVYMDLAQVGDGDNYIGADVILRWYERNMKIFVNICRLVSSPDDRVLVVIGGGHLPLLAHFIEGSGRYTLEQASSYL